MTIEEAIHNQQLHLDGNPNLHDIKLRQSMHMGIEALKLIKWSRDNHVLARTNLLPFETKE